MPRIKKLTDYSYSPTNPASEDAIRLQIDDSIQEVYDAAAKNTDTVNLTGAQTVGGIKTFTDGIKVPVASAVDNPIRKDTFEAHKTSSDHDGRYPTEAEVNALLLANQLGNHEGTWQGRTPVESDPGIQAIVNEHSYNFSEIAYFSNSIGLVGDDIVDNSTFAISFISLVGNNSVDLYIGKGVYKFSNSVVFPANITLHFSNGAIFKPIATKSVTINGNIIASKTKIFELSYTGTTPALMVLTSFVDGLSGIDLYPEHFGAVGDYDYVSGTGTDDSISFQKTILTIERNVLSRIHFSDKNYSIQKTVVIRKTGLRLTGGGSIKDVGYTASKPVGFIVGASTATSILDYGNGENTNLEGHMEFEGVKFFAGKIGNVSQTALIYTQNDNGPHRGLNILKCSFEGFTKALRFNPPSNVLAVANLNVEGCYFRGDYAIYADKEVLGLRFVNNQSEQGGAIYGKISSGIEISDNMLEGQPNTIDILGTTSLLHLRGNYFEANTGKITFRPTISATSTIDIEPQRTGGDKYLISSAIVKASKKYNTSLEFLNYSTWQPGTDISGITPCFDTVGAGSDIAVGGFFKPEDYVGMNLPSTITTFANYRDTVPTIIKTPVGNRKATTHTTLSGFLTMTMAYSAGDYIVFSLPIKYKDLDQSAVSFYLLCYNQANAIIGGGNFEGFRLDNQWYILTGCIKAGLAGTSLKIKLNPYGSTGATGTGCYVGEIFAYVSPIDGNSRVFVYPYLPFDDQI